MSPGLWIPALLLLTMQTVAIVLLMLKTRQLSWQVHRLVDEVQQVGRQTEFLDRLLRTLELERGMLPPSRVWSASPDLLLMLAEHCLEHRPRTIVDCGSGLSTLVLARCCELNGRGRVISLEQSDDHADTVRRHLSELGLEDLVDLCSSDLENHRVDGETLRWYPLGGVPESGIDLVLVDGPSNSEGTGARYPAGPLLIPRLATGGVIVVDDAAREDEAASIRRWLELHPGLTVDHLDLDKGGAVLRQG